MDSNYCKALEKVNKARKQNVSYNCYKLIPGPTGPTGPSGSGISILGVYDSVEQLINTNPSGKNGEAFIIGDDLYVWANNYNKWVNVGRFKGEEGPMGPTGPMGLEGPQGPMGPEGIMGVQGNPGVEGPMGPTGPQGEEGPMGPMGPMGLEGPQGKTGEKGEMGPPGTSVTILGSFDSISELKAQHPIGKIGQSYLVGESLYVWADESQEWENVGIIKGPRGEQGIAGPQGVQGPIGPMGPQGERGIQGPQGEQGIPGPRGEQGIQGIEGPRGEMGPRGEQGIAGPQGVQGPIGPIGPQGIDGPTGPTGPTGPKGDIGPMGPQGERGLMGEQGFPGLKGPTGPTGPQGVPGPNGPIGPKGEPGTSTLPVAFFMTANNEDAFGYAINPNARIPIEVKTIDVGNNFQLNNNTITFLYPGVYRVDVMVEAYSQNALLQPKTGIVSIGFKKVGEETIYVGGSMWDYQEPCVRLNAFGIISTTLPDEEFELINTSTDEINLISPNINRLTTTSSFTNTVVTIIIEKIQ